MLGLRVRGTRLQGSRALGVRVLGSRVLGPRMAARRDDSSAAPLREREQRGGSDREHQTDELRRRDPFL